MREPKNMRPIARGTSEITKPKRKALTTLPSTASNIETGAKRRRSKVLFIFSQGTLNGATVVVEKKRVRAIKPGKRFTAWTSGPIRKAKKMAMGKTGPKMRTAGWK